jgi:hypothetical protein
MLKIAQKKFLFFLKLNFNVGKKAKKKFQERLKHSDDANGT